ncbi:Bug family tripartite tricarboxylate transporter substrate binding protein [Pigmentiphaga litoralis]|uniref:Bug family tripartite tricarboxylate transporter substrate binding protein n=1 Tax=Pigmentiphaga litoralis TaxID=516702 RepID=UPI003B439EF4
MTLTQTLCAAALALATTGAHAQSYPAKPIKLIIGYPAGGGADVVGRVVAQKLGERLGQPIVVENRGGAAGVIATTAAAQVAPDGYTLLLGHVNALSIAPAAPTPLAYEATRDFAPVGYIGFVPNILVVNPASGIKSVADVVAHARKQPGKLSFASPGVGSTNHLAGEMFKSAAGVQMLHVPYRGSAPAITDLLGGQVTMNFDALSSVSNFVRQGKMTALAVTSKERNPAFPNVPTMVELGYKSFDVTIWYGIVAPVKTPADIVNVLNREINAVLVDAGVARQLAELGVQPQQMTPAAFGSLIRQDTDKYGQVIKQAGIVME